MTATGTDTETKVVTRSISIPAATPSNTTCKVRVIDEKEQNAYIHPVPARTQRFGTTPPDTPDDVFHAGEELGLDARYGRNGNEAYVYRVLSKGNIVLEDPLWIATNQGTITQEGVSDPGDCDTLQSLDIVPRGQQGSPEYLREEAIENIRDYGIEIINDGLDWTNTDLNEILLGVGTTGRAFTLIGVIGDNQQQRFRTVMFQGIPADEPDYIWLMRLAATMPENSPYQEYYVEENDPENVPGGSGVCFTFQGLNPPAGRKPRAITCRGSLQITQHTIVHELGHIFDNRSTRVTALRERLHDFEDYGRDIDLNTVVRDCGFELDQNGHYVTVPPQQVAGNDYPVMGAARGVDNEGNPDGRWGRGRRGWESTPVTYPNPTPTTFQQHPESYTSDEDREGEAAADMFLNWVYRRTSDNTIPTGGANGACYPPGSSSWTSAEWNALAPGNWEGFQNVNEYGQPDYRLPGNRRFWWMEEQMNDILTLKGWK